MRDYEILFLVRPELDEEQLNQASAGVSTLIETLGGQSQRTNIWGRRRLAYEVDHVREGYYVLTDFRLDPERVPELEATLQISETVFRHLVVRKPDLKARRPRPGAVDPKADAAETAAVEVPAAAEADTAAPAPGPAQPVAEEPSPTSTEVPE